MQVLELARIPRLDAPRAPFFGSQSILPTSCVLCVHAQHAGG